MKDKADRKQEYFHWELQQYMYKKFGDALKQNKFAFVDEFDDEFPSS